jgi:hypothetical protein
MKLEFTQGRKIYLFHGFSFLTAFAAASIALFIWIQQYWWIAFSIVLGVIFAYMAYHGYRIIQNNAFLYKQGFVAMVGGTKDSYRAIRWSDIDYIRPRENATYAFEVRIKKESPSYQYFMATYPALWQGIDKLPEVRGHLAFFTDLLSDTQTKDQEVLPLAKLVKLLNDYKDAPQMRANLPDAEAKYLWQPISKAD